MKNIFRWILALAELGAAALFLLNEASDLQLGFGLVFLFLGVSAAISTVK